jgi:hypothetical protein
MTPHRFDVLDASDGDDRAFEIAHAVSAKVAAELSGLPAAFIEDSVLEFGELGVTNVLQGEGIQELLIRRTHDDG